MPQPSDLLIEPLGLLDGPAAREAVEAGAARWLAGGPFAFSLARVDGRILPVAELSASAVLHRLTAAPPVWAGFDGPIPIVMGVLNVTPDSFSDGGDFADTDRAVAAGLAMAAAGADIVDVGGESSRPGAPPTSPREEAARILPVVRALANSGVTVSIDSRNASTMQRALAAGARIVNDISGLSHDPASAPLVAEAGCPVVVMHMRHDPTTMTRRAGYDDVATEVIEELALRVSAAEAAGIRRDRIAIDPGIGFAKTMAHNLALLPRLAMLCSLGCPILVGVSRKGFIGRLGGAPPRDRAPGSIAAALYALDRGARILRVHDVPETIQAIRVWRGIVGLG